MKSQVRAAEGPYHAGVWQRRLRQDFTGDGISGARRPSIRRAGVCMEFEEATDKLTANVGSMGLDLRELVKRKKLWWTMFASSETRLKRPGIQSRRPVHPTEPRGQHDKSETRRTGQHRVAVCRIIRRSDPASGAAPAVPLVGRAQPYSYCYRGTGNQWHDKPSRTGRIHRGLRDPAGPSGQ
jgi:hypothetical protein